MKKLILCLLLIVNYNVFCQDTIFFDSDWKKINTYKQSEYYSIILRDNTDTSKAKVTTFFKSGQIRQELFYSNLSKHLRDGASKTWYNDGKLKEEAYYADNKLHGKLQTFWDNGRLKRDDLYEKGKLIEGKIYNSDGAPTQYYDYEIMPQFPGGFNELVRFLTTHLKYPKKARRQGIQGKVVLKFIVDSEGSIQNITVAKSVSEELDNEAIRVVKKMPKWQPGLFDGTKANVYYLLPVSFKLTQ